jgi:hypothetical protein
MCAVSMVMDHYRDKWRPLVPQPWETAPSSWTLPVPSPISPAEIEEFRRLLERAREYDRKNNEPDCELAEKRDAVKELADRLGVKVDFV